MERKMGDQEESNGGERVRRYYKKIGENFFLIN